MQEKKLISAFFAANMFDTIVSLYALESLEGFSEIGVMGANYSERGDIYTAAIVKTGVIALLIGAYALSKSLKKDSRLVWPLEKALKISNVLVWAPVTINVLQVAPYVMAEF